MAWRIGRSGVVGCETVGWAACCQVVWFVAVAGVVDGHAAWGIAGGEITGADAIGLPDGPQFIWFVVGSVTGVCRMTGVVGVNHVA